ncbi:MAG TPA: hypothetical protein VG963_16865 [Polyangiaceae bacterium]|nr:hypothetical protein [Polyangiaceae bacterium]
MSCSHPHTSSSAPRELRDLPWGHRIAALLLHLAGDTLDAFGRVVYAEFIRAAVRGMPDTSDGKPAFDLIQAVHRKGADALPPGYGRPFASRAFKVMLAKFGDPTLVADAMGSVMEKAVRGKLHIANGSSLRAAETYILVALANAIRDSIRARKRRGEVPLVREDDDYADVDVEDPAAFKDLERAMAPAELTKLMEDLRGVHPRAPDWLRARLEGDSGREIAEEWGTTPSWISKWQRIYLPGVKRVIEHHLRAARTFYNYDRRSAEA